MIALLRLPGHKILRTCVTTQVVSDYAFSQTGLRKSGPCGAV
jgi:hypothetical protein